MTAVSRQVFLDKGRFLFLQGQAADSFFILKSGAVEVLINDETTTPSEKDVLASARRIAVIDQPNTPVGEIGALEDTDRTASIRALDRCELIFVAGGKRAIAEWIHNNLPAGLLIARTLMTRVLDNHRRWHEIRILEERIRVYIDNFTILYTIFNTRSPGVDTANARLVQRGRELLAKLGPSQAPGLSDVDRGLPPDSEPSLNEPFAEVELAHFLNHILEQPDLQLGWLIAPQPPPHPLMFISTRLTDLLPRISRELHLVMRHAETTTDALFGPDGLIQSWIRLYGHLSAEQRDAARPYIERLLAITRDLRQRIQRAWGETFPQTRDLFYDIELLERAARGEIPIPSALHAGGAAVSAPSADGASAGAGAAAALSGPVLDLRVALADIILDPSEQEDLDFVLGLKDAEPKRVYAAYWNLYPRIWRETRGERDPAITALLRFGIASPVPISRPDKLNLSTEVTGPVLFADQWLERIYNEKNPPSRNDLGQSYEDLLRDNRMARYAPNDPDPRMDKVRFEVNEMMAKAARAFSAGRGEIAIIRRTAAEVDALIPGMNTPARVAESLVRVIQVDFTAFMRDVRVTVEERSEFLPKEVLPFLIILPASGERGVSWQEYEARAKDTPGRIILPLLSGDIVDMIIAVVAKYRWELAKTVAGADWMNPADGGLTGRYFDYCNFFKKSSELTDEQKEKLAEMYASATMDSDRFALEYAMWLRYESQGIQKLNKVARRIFAEFCPFNLELRKRLIRQPAYTDVLRKDSNRRLKRKQELERRIYKLERNGVTIGDVFETAMRIFQELPE
jgi:CRP-like cAMP-binding protein